MVIVIRGEGVSMNNGGRKLVQIFKKSRAYIMTHILP